jgi:hypothetical protein
MGGPLTAWAARLGTVLLLGVLALGSAATAARVGGGNPNGRWATPAAIQAIILTHQLGVGSAPCPKVMSCDVWGGPVKVSSATVAGIPPSRTIEGVRHFQLFEVRACTIFYYRGPHRFSFHFRWFTRRPPGGTIETMTRNGTIAVIRDNGEPYARDWNHPLSGPQAHGRC